MCMAEGLYAALGRGCVKHLVNDDVQDISVSEFVADKRAGCTRILRSAL